MTSGAHVIIFSALGKRARKVSTRRSPTTSEAQEAYSISLAHGYSPGFIHSGVTSGGSVLSAGAGAIFVSPTKITLFPVDSNFRKKDPRAGFHV